MLQRAKPLHRMGVKLVFAVHPFDMRAHRVRSTITIAPQDSDHDAIMLGM